MTHRIFHASDLHFGKANPDCVQQLHEAINKTAPNLVVLSGDFVQIGSRKEFQLASDFVRGIRFPVFCVPGNHDIPRFSTWERFVTPYARYRKWICKDLCPVHEDDAVIVAGINTARRIVPHWNWSHGMISKSQIDTVIRTFREAPPEKARVFVCHHPLLTASDAPIDTIVWRGHDMAQALIDLKTELVLTGHIHHASVTTTGGDTQLASIGAASATSTRLRDQTNGFNVIETNESDIQIAHHHWDGYHFRVRQTHSLARNHSGKR